MNTPTKMGSPPPQRKHATSPLPPGQQRPITPNSARIGTATRIQSAGPTRHPASATQVPTAGMAMTPDHQSRIQSPSSQTTTQLIQP